MKQVNKFMSGVKKFKDFSLYKNTEWTFPALNIRVLNTVDEGFLVTPINSTEVLFTAPSHYHVIGAKDYKGKIFFVLRSMFNNNIEIGVYPSPENWADTPQQYEKTYKALFNLDKSGVVSNFRTDKLKFELNRELDIIVKEISDHSVNLYLSDFTHPNVIINSGFDIDNGNLVGTTINENSFYSANALITNADSVPIIEYKGLSHGGNNLPGTYEIFFRYVTKNFVRTNFFTSISPVIVSNISDRKSPEGVSETDLDGVKQYTQSIINLEVDNSSLDNNFEYIEIAILRKSASETGGPIRDTYLIAKLYNISSFATNNDILITGNESRAALSESELLYGFIPANINKTQTVVNARYFAGNWKGFAYDENALKNYAKNIKADIVYGDIIDDTNLYDTSGEFDNEQHRLNSLTEGTTTYDSLSYFRGEIVPFAAVFVIKGGFITPAFPIDGMDAHTIASKFNETDKYSDVKGLVRFPEISVANEAQETKISDIRYPLGVSFNNTNAISLLSNNGYDFDNIIGFYIVRGERIKNLLYQGILVPMINKYYEYHDDPDPATFENTYCKFPFLQHRTFDYGNNLYYSNYPITKFTFDSNGDVAEALRTYFNGYLSETEFALFTPDYIFNEKRNINDGASIHLKSLFTLNETETAVTTETNPTSSYYEYDFSSKAMKSYSSSAMLSYVNQGVFVKGGYSSYVRAGNYGSNYLTHNTYLDSNGDRITYENRPLVSPNYIAIKLPSVPTSSDVMLAIVNIYKTENTFDSTGATGFYKVTRDSFSVENSQYWIINKFAELATNISTIKNFKGDAFVQRFVFRINYTFGSDDVYTRDPDKNTNPYGYGSLASILVESSVNIAMRNNTQGIDPDNPNEKIDYSYYPAVLNKGKSLHQWLVSFDDKGTLYEAFHINQGYNEVYSLQKFNGVDFNRNVSDLKYQTRIFFSHKSGINELYDNYRTIGALSYQDLPLSNGSITKLLSHFNTLISVQENSINRHYIGTKKMQADNGAADIVLKESGLYLSDEFKVLANYGSQHITSIVYGHNGIYGVDLRNGFVIWMIGIGSSQYTGKSSFNTIDLSQKGEIRGWLDEFIYENDLDKILTSVEDKAINGVGIVSGFNKRYKEIYFTFHIGNDPITIVPEEFSHPCVDRAYLPYETIYNAQLGWIYYPSGYNVTCLTIKSSPYSVVTPDMFNPFISGMQIEGGKVYYVSDDTTGVKTAYIAYQSYLSLTNFEDLGKDGSGLRYGNEINYIENKAISKTLVYSELLQAFICEFSATPGLYATLNENMISVPTIKENPLNKIYIHDKENDYLNYFDSDEEMKISVIVNGGEKAVVLMKIFESYEIASSSEDFLKIEFYTDTMEGDLDPFIPNVWRNEYLRPKYKENRWRGPIPYNKDVDPFNVDDHLRGEWLKIVLTFKKNMYFYIREIITDFTQSFI